MRGIVIYRPKPYTLILSKMLRFFFSHIFKNIPRSLSIVVSIFIVCITVFGSTYLYKNISSAIEYYAGHGNDERRITLAGSHNILSLFNNESSMNNDTVKDILDNPLLENIQIFRLVDIPVSAKFGFLGFSMESDIPVFSVTDMALTGATTPVGMSRIMIDLYNTQFAGSSPYFPQMRDVFLRGQKIEFTFGKSKIFQSSNTIAEPIIGTVTTISHDFPAFGLVLPESIVQKKMNEAGFVLGNPYKITAYMTDISHKDTLAGQYGDLNIKFESDQIAATKTKIYLAGTIVAISGLFMIVMMGIFFAFLLG